MYSTLLYMSNIYLYIQPQWFGGVESVRIRSESVAEVSTKIIPVMSPQLFPCALLQKMFTV